MYYQADTQVAPQPEWEQLTNFPDAAIAPALSPDGRMLTYLQASQGVDLNRYVGRSMGITGKRYHRDDWNADTLIVQTLQPVQLRGAR